MDKQPFIDRILETENLTGDLEDDAADHLLNWGINQLDRLLADVADEEAAHEKVHALMQAMRGVNWIVANPSTPAPGKVTELAAHYAQAFGKTAAESANHNAIAAEVSGLEGLEAVKFLLDWVQKK